MLKFLAVATTGLNLVGAAWVFLLALLICTDIFMRWLFNSPVLGVPEFVQYSIAGIIYLQLGHAIREGKMIRSDAFYAQMYVRYPHMIQALLGACDLLCAGIFGLLAWGMLPEVVESFQMNYQIGNRLYFTLPDWPVKFTICLGATMSFIHAAIHAFIHFGMALRQFELPTDPNADLNY